MEGNLAWWARHKTCSRGEEGATEPLKFFECKERCLAIEGQKLAVHSSL